MKLKLFHEISYQGLGPVVIWPHRMRAAALMLRSEDAWDFKRTLAIGLSNGGYVPQGRTRDPKTETRDAQGQGSTVC